MSEEEARSLLRRCSAVAKQLLMCPDSWIPEAAAEGTLLGEALQTLAGHCAPAALPRLLLSGAGHPLARAAAALQLLWVAAEPEAPAGGAATSDAPPPPQCKQTLCTLCAGLAAVLEPLHAFSQTAEQPVAQGVSLKSHLRMVCSVALSLAKVGHTACREGGPSALLPALASSPAPSLLLAMWNLGAGWQMPSKVEGWRTPCIAPQTPGVSGREPHCRPWRPNPGRPRHCSSGAAGASVQHPGRAGALDGLGEGWPVHVAVAGSQAARAVQRAVGSSCEASMPQPHLPCPLSLVLYPAGKWAAAPRGERAHPWPTP